MSIYINKDTKVITQGITGKTGQFHTRMCRDYANGKNCFVAGVTPGKGGQDFEGIPIYASVTFSVVAPPPTSRKLAGLPPKCWMMSMVAMARPAPLTRQAMLPSSLM